MAIPHVLVIIVTALSTGQTIKAPSDDIHLSKSQCERQGKYVTRNLSNNARRNGFNLKITYDCEPRR